MARVTDDERRRAAAERLRKARFYTLVGKRDDGLVVEWNVALMSELADAVGLKDSVGFEVFDRLADLIDPEERKGLESDAFGREALLALADDLETYRLPISGIAVAERIREACGVVA